MVKCYSFNRRTEKNGESVSQFVAELQRLSEHCVAPVIQLYFQNINLTKRAKKKTTFDLHVYVYGTGGVNIHVA